MAATIQDLSRRGDQGQTIPSLCAEVDGLLAAWIATANAQNPTRLLTVLRDSAAAAPRFCGWTLRAQLAALDGASPAQLMSQWVIDLSSGLVTMQAALAAGYTAGEALGGHGSLSGGVGTTSSQITLINPLPLGAVVASSLVAGQEFFAFCLSQHTFSNRQAVPLLIAKDVISGEWHLSATDMAGVIATVAWRLNTSQAFLSSGFRLDWPASGPPYLLSRPAQWRPNTPTVVYVTPLPPVQWWDPVVLPQDLALYNRTGTSFGYFKAADGSEWLQLGPSRLAVRVKDPT
jgi:hypothetical protein